MSTPGTEPEPRGAGGRKEKGAPNVALLIIGTLFVLAVVIWFLPGLR